MKRRLYPFLLLLLPAAALSLHGNRAATLREYDLSAQPATRFSLPNNLMELSGLACSADGRVFAHNDETGTIFQIDATTGKVITSFMLGGKKVVREDFEGIAIAHGKFYLSTSAGDIYECSEGENGSVVDYTIYKTRLGKRYEMEGLCYDPRTDALLLTVKTAFKEKKRDERPVFAFSLASKKLEKKPRFVLPGSLSGGDFHPSSIEYNPATGTLFVLAAQGHTVIEISATGDILARQPLDARRFFQPEGLTFTPDGRLLIGSEGDKNDTQTPASLTVFSAKRP